MATAIIDLDRIVQVCIAPDGEVVTVRLAARGADGEEEVRLEGERAAEFLAALRANSGRYYA